MFTFRQRQANQTKIRGIWKMIFFLPCINVAYYDLSKADLLLKLLLTIKTCSRHTLILFVKSIFEGKLILINCLCWLLDSNCLPTKIRAHNSMFTCEDARIFEFLFNGYLTCAYFWNILYCFLNVNKLIEFKQNNLLKSEILLINALSFSQGQLELDILV